MKEMPKAGTLVRFAKHGVPVTADNAIAGYVTSTDAFSDTMRVCTRPGVYWTVDRATAQVV